LIGNWKKTSYLPMQGRHTRHTIWKLLSYICVGEQEKSNTSLQQGTHDNPFNKIRVATNPQLIRTQSESPSLRKGLRSLPITVEIENIPSMVPTAIEEGQSLLAIADKNYITRVLPAKRLVRKSREVQSSARYITETDLQTARHVQEPTTQSKRKGSQKAGREPAAKRGQQKYQVGVGMLLGWQIVGCRGTNDRGLRKKASMRGQYWMRFLKIQCTRLEDKPLGACSAMQDDESEGQGEGGGRFSTSQ